MKLKGFYFSPETGNDGGVQQGIQNLLGNNNNDAMAVVRLLYGDNYKLRDDLRNLRGKVPAEGAVVLSGDDAEAWAAYQKLGKPAAISQAVSEREQFQGELTTLRRAQTLRDVAEVEGVKYTVLAGLDKPGIAYEVKEADGKRTATVTVDGKTQPFADYAATVWADYLPALKPATTTQPQGVQYFRQHAGGSTGSPTGIVDQMITANKERSQKPNALTQKG